MTLQKGLCAPGHRAGISFTQSQGDAAAHAVPRHQQGNAKVISTERTLSLYSTSVNSNILWPVLVSVLPAR